MNARQAVFHATYGLAAETCLVVLFAHPRLTSWFVMMPFHNALAQHSQSLLTALAPPNRPSSGRVVYNTTDD